MNNQLPLKGVPVAINFHLPSLAFGEVVEVDGMAVTIKAADLRRTHEAIDYSVELGNFILVESVYSDLVASVSRIQLLPPEGKRKTESKLVTCVLVGFLRGGTSFERGVERYPTIGSKAFLLTEGALTAMFRQASRSVAVGERCQRGGGVEHVIVDRFFGRHTAILGTSGSGKSWTVASIIQSTMTALPHTHIVFLDLHDEYRAAFPEEDAQRRVRHIRTPKFSLPYWCLNYDELLTLFALHESAANQAALLRQVIGELRRNQAAGDESASITVDSPVFFSYEDLLSRLEEHDVEMVAGAKGSGSKQGTNYGKLTNLVLRLKGLRDDPRFGFLFPSEQTTFSAYLSSVFATDSSVQLTILDLSGLPSEAISIIVGVLCRLAFDFKYWERAPADFPITLVLEEAHNYLPRSPSAADRICLERVERIAKEGRKYGVGLVVVSQRPSELSETVLSQCGNFAVLRLTNPRDQDYVRGLLPDFLAVAVDMLPYLRTGEAVIAGEAVEVPTRVRIHPPSPTPRSEDVPYYDRWLAGVPADFDPSVTLTRWRRRQR